MSEIPREVPVEWGQTPLDTVADTNYDRALREVTGRMGANPTETVANLANLEGRGFYNAQSNPGYVNIVEYYGRFLDELDIPEAQRHAYLAGMMQGLLLDRRALDLQRQQDEAS